MSDNEITRLDEREWNWGKLSRLVCVSDGNDGAVCFHVGGHIESHIEGIGSNKLSDLGLDAPPGVTIFEGKYVGGSTHRNMEGDYDDPDFVGKFREPTDEEWKAIRSGEPPWDVNEWFLLPGQCCQHDPSAVGNCQFHSAPGVRRTGFPHV